MIRSKILIVAALALAVLAVGPAAGASLDHVKVEVNVEPSAKTLGAYECTAKITDRETGEVISAPFVTFMAGSPATVMSGLQAIGDDGNKVPATFKMEVSVSEEEATASYHSRIYVGDQVVNEQSFQFRLPEKAAQAAKLRAIAIDAGITDPDRIENLPMTLSLKNADLRDVLNVFAASSGRELRVHDGVDGKVTVELRGVPWRQALDQILRINDLEMAMQDDVLEIGPVGQLD